MADRVMLADNKPITDEMLQMHFDEVGFLYAQPKVDGMRVYHGKDHIPQSRSGKEWKNKPMRAWCQNHPSMAGIDGEAVPGHIYTEHSFRQGMSGTRKEEGSREFTFFAFDYIGMANGFDADVAFYEERLGILEDIQELFGEFQEAEGYHAKLVVCPTFKVTTVEEARNFEEQMVADNWEGAMLRRPDRPYKFGRSTNRGGELIKLKRYEDSEAIVVGYEPWYHNENEPTLSELGYTRRSSHQAGKVALERLGAWHVELLTDRSVKFKIGVMRGVSHEDRDRLWANRDAYIGSICKFSHQGVGGGYDVPRQPVFLNWRSQTEF